MNRRMALFLTLLMGDSSPRACCAARHRPAGPTKDRGPALEPAKGRRASSTSLTRRSRRATPRPSDDDPPPNLPGRARPELAEIRHQPLHRPRPDQSTPQNGIIEWIFRRTGTGPWHGDKIAVLRQPDPDPRLPRRGNAQDGGRGRRAVHQRRQRHPFDPGPGRRGRRYPLAVRRLLAAHPGRQRSAGTADLDHEDRTTPPSCSPRCRSTRASSSWSTRSTR